MIKKNEITKSPQTTIYGISIAVIALITAILPLIDSNPETMFSNETLMLSVSQVAAAIGLIKARDHGVSSEQAKE